MKKMLLADVNVWLTLTFDSHAHHPSAKTWFDALVDEVCYFCRVTQQGFLRLATNPRVFGSDALTSRDAWKKYDLLRSDRCVSYANEPIDLEHRWRGLTETQDFLPSVWTDAYLGRSQKHRDTN